jgi:FGGY-family pentulose kinase
MAMRHYVGIDVGTGSVRAGVFDARGIRLGMGVESISVSRPEADFVEQSSDDIWRAAGVAVRAALAEADVSAETVAGIGFDATCSLVLLDGHDRPVTVSPGGDDRWNVIVWMDHRAMEQAARINRGGHEVLRYVGGVISPEMETPKLLWLKENLPASYGRAARFLDLADFLSYRATGNDARSLCTTVCKWTYVGRGSGGEGSGGWDESYFRSIGLGDLVDDGFARIGRSVRPQGERAGELSADAARDLGLVAGIPVGIGIIDAHAGGLGMLGIAVGGAIPTEETLEERLALIGGTSSCHMAVSREAKLIPGIWGPYFSAMVPGLWLTEGGQSATGALLDHVIDAHARGAELRDEARRGGTSAHALLGKRVEALSEKLPFPAALTDGVHVLPDHHGNRSPRADPTLRGMISGLSLDDSIDALAVVYHATVQALAHGTRHIVETMNRHGYRISTLIACGGDTKNPLFVREHADVTGCRVVIPREPEAVLLGAAMLGAVASGDHASLLSAMATMNDVGDVVEPAGGTIAAFHARKHAVFRRLYDDQMAYRGLMEAKV